MEEKSENKAYLYALVTINKCQQIAGKELGYPWFKDDQKNFPGATEMDGVCIGEHVEETIVDELAKSHRRLLDIIKEAKVILEQRGFNYAQTALDKLREVKHK